MEEMKQHNRTEVHLKPFQIVLEEIAKREGARQ
jgi:hypothetical protein